MASFKNLYAILGISPLATPEKIQAALKNAAGLNKITLEDAQYIKQFLLNAETRKKYDAKLFAEFPEMLQQAIDERAVAQAEQMQKNKEAEPQGGRSLSQMRSGSEAPKQPRGRGKAEMSYIKQSLNNEENIIYKAQVSAMSQIIPILFGSLCALIWLGSLFSSSLLSWPYFIIAVISLGKVAITILTTELALTNKRVIAKFGFISRKSIEIRIQKIESISVNQGVLGRMLNYGTIHVNGTGQNFAPIPNIDNPLEFRRQVSQYLDDM